MGIVLEIFCTSMDIVEEDFRDIKKLKFLVKLPQISILYSIHFIHKYISSSVYFFSSIMPPYKVINQIIENCKFDEYMAEVYLPLTTPIALTTPLIPCNHKWIHIFRAAKIWTAYQGFIFVTRRSRFQNLQNKTGNRILIHIDI